MPLLFQEFAALPGISDIRQSVEGNITWGPWEFNRSYIVPSIIDGAARDAGGSPTTLLRPGLLMGQVTSSKKLKEWSPTATDGTENLFGILLYALNTQAYGADQDRWFGWVLCGGLVKQDGIIIPGESSAGLRGKTLEQYVRHLLGGRYVLDDDIEQRFRGPEFTRIVHKTADYTVQATDHGTLFTNKGATGAVTFTLPDVTKSQGLRFLFQAYADQNLTVASAAAGQLVVINNQAASSVTLSTAAEKIGGGFEVIGLDNSKWLVIPRLWEAQTVTIA